MDQTYIFVIIGIIAGFLGGLLGIGGAIVIVPALVYFAGYSQHLAQGTTLLMLALPVGLLGALHYYKMGNVDVKTSLILAASFFLASLLGAKLANQVPQEILKKLFAFLLLAIAIKMLFFDGKPFK